MPRSLTLFLLLTAATLASCSGSSGFVSKENGKSQPMLNETKNTEEQKTSNSDPEVAPPPTPLPTVVAVPPVSIGGAFLTCSVVKTHDDIECVFRDTAGAVVPVVIDTAYIIAADGKNTNWILTTFTAGAPGYYTVKPVSMRNAGFAVGLVYGTDKVAYDVIETDPKVNAFVNLIADPSFEKLGVVSSKALYQTIEGALSMDWKVKFAANSKCSAGTPVIEVPTAPSLGFPAAEGSKFVELDGRCSDKERDTKGNIAVSQSIPLIKDHFYHISFASRLREGHDVLDLQSLQVSWGAEILPIGPLSSERWETRKYMKKATVSGPLVLSLEEIGLENGRGSAIDNIVVYDLGEVPAP